MLPRLLTSWLECRPPKTFTASTLQQSAAGLQLTAALLFPPPYLQVKNEDKYAVAEPPSGEASPLASPLGRLSTDYRPSSFDLLLEDMGKRVAPAAFADAPHVKARPA